MEESPINGGDDDAGGRSHILWADSTLYGNVKQRSWIASEYSWHIQERLKLLYLMLFSSEYGIWYFSTVLYIVFYTALLHILLQKTFNSLFFHAEVLQMNTLCAT